MKKRIYIISVVALLIVTILGAAGIYFSMREKPSEDALRFKEEYESLNGTIRESDGAKYNDIKIPKKNPIVYINCEEAIDVLDENQAIIYVGANWCPWCRNAISVLFDVAKDYKVDKIYYLDLDNEKSSYEVKNGELVKTKDGSKAYYELLEKLSDRLDDYIITDDEKKYETGEKRIYMPYVVGIRNGKVAKDHVGTVSLDDGQTKYDEMSENQRKALTNTYDELIKSVYGKSIGTCDDAVCN